MFFLTGDVFKSLETRPVHFQYPESITYDNARNLVQQITWRYAPVCTAEACLYALRTELPASQFVGNPIKTQSVLETFLLNPLDREGVVHLAFSNTFFDTTSHQNIRVVLVDYLADGVVDVYIEEEVYGGNEAVSAIAWLTCFEESESGLCGPASISIRPHIKPDVYQVFATDMQGKLSLGLVEYRK